MDELGRFLKRFVYRDIAYIVGGASVLLSLLRLVDRVPTADPGLPTLFFSSGVAYVVGYVVQDTCSILGIVTTRSHFRPGWLLQRIYALFEDRPWRDIPAPTPNHQSELLDKPMSDRADVEHERIASLRQVGTTIGPCWLLSAGLLFTTYWRRSGDALDLALAVSATIAGLLLIVLSWLKGMQLVALDHQQP